MNIYIIDKGVAIIAASETDAMRLAKKAGIDITDDELSLALIYPLLQNSAKPHVISFFGNDEIGEAIRRILNNKDATELYSKGWEDGTWCHEFWIHRGGKEKSDT